jgi:DNA-binding NarL/FixJ family response regulator
MEKLRIGLVDDHALFRDALGEVLRTRGFDPVVAASDGRAAIAAVDEARPDVVLLDVALPGTDGIALASELVARPSNPKILMLSAYATPRIVAFAFDAGAHGFALKSDSMEELMHGIRTVADGKRYVASGLAAVESLRDGPLASLSTRERQIFRLIVAGMSVAEIASSLFISAKTVDTHRSHIYRKLEVHTAIQLMRYAMTHDLLIERTVTGELDRRR